MRTEGCRERRDFRDECVRYLGAAAVYAAADSAALARAVAVEMFVFQLTEGGFDTVCLSSGGVAAIKRRGSPNQREGVAAAGRRSKVAGMVDWKRQKRHEERVRRYWEGRQATRTGLDAG